MFIKYIKDKTIVKNKKNMFLVFFFIVFFIFFIWNYSRSILKKCKVNIFIKNIEGYSMEPKILNWTKIELVEWYYNCNPLKIWEIIAYRYDENKFIKEVNKDRKNKIKLLKTENIIFVKLLKAKWWDKIYFKNNNIYINDIEMINSIWKKYIFSKEEKDLMYLFLKNNKLKKWYFFVFWDNIKSSKDSRKIWWIKKENIIWKINFVSKNTPE